MAREVFTLQDVFNAMGCTHEEFESITGYCEADFPQQHGADVETLDNPIMSKMAELIEQVEANLKENRVTKKMTKIDARRKLADIGDEDTEHYYLNEWFRTPLDELDNKKPIEYLTAKKDQGVEKLMEITADTDS